jgi:hypothetical protein
MRLVDLSDFTVPQRAICYIHASAAAPPDNSLAIVVASVSTGLQPCRGADTDLTDGYQGDVFKSEGGPIGGVLVRYWGDMNGQRVLAGETRTDNAGRHSLGLPPGRYFYEFVLPRGELGTPVTGAASVPGVTIAAEPDTGLRVVVVEKGHKVRWEEAESLQVDTLGAPPPSVEREIAFVCEEWMGDWNEEDAVPWSWIDVEEVIKDLAKRITTSGAILRAVTFSAGGHKFPRPDLITALRRAGVPSNDSGLSSRHLSLSFRNLKSLLGDGYVRLRPYERATFSMLRTNALPNGLEPRTQGIPVYLTEARAVCLSTAAQIAGQNSQGRLTVFNPSARRDAMPSSLSRMGWPGTGHQVVTSVPGSDNVPGSTSTSISTTPKEASPPTPQSPSSAPETQLSSDG